MFCLNTLAVQLSAKILRPILNLTFYQLSPFKINAKISKLLKSNTLLKARTNLGKIGEKMKKYLFPEFEIVFILKKEFA